VLVGDVVLHESVCCVAPFPILLLQRGIGQDKARQPSKRRRTLELIEHGRDGAIRMRRDPAAAPVALPLGVDNCGRRHHGLCPIENLLQVLQVARSLVHRQRTFEDIREGVVRVAIPARGLPSQQACVVDVHSVEELLVVIEGELARGTVDSASATRGKEHEQENRDAPDGHNEPAREH
jgi:hypothetical protein